MGRPINADERTSERRLHVAKALRHGLTVTEIVKMTWPDTAQSIGSEAQIRDDINLIFAEYASTNPGMLVMARYAKDHAARMLLTVVEQAEIQLQNGETHGKSTPGQMAQILDVKRKAIADYYEVASDIDLEDYLRGKISNEYVKAKEQLGKMKSHAR